MWLLHDGESILATTHKRRSENSSVDYLLSFDVYVGPRVQIHIVRHMWQVVTEPYYWLRTESFLYGRMDMTRKRLIGANQPLRDCFL